MRRVLALFLTLLVPVTLTASACGDGGGDGNGDGKQDTGVTDTGNGGGDDTSVDEETGNGGDDTSEEGCTIDKPLAFSGTLSTHPATAAIDSGATLEETALGIYSALGIISGSPSPLSLGTDSGPCEDAVQEFTASETSAMFSLDPVDVSPISIAAVSMVDDVEGAEDRFANTATGLAASEDFGMDQTDLQSFVVSNATIETLAQISGNSASDFMSNGIMLGMFIDGDGDPVSGLTVGEVSGGQVDPLEDAIYPNSDFSDATTGVDGSTSDTGVFIVPDKSLTEFGGTKGTGSVDTATQQGATSPNVVFTLFLEVN